MPPCGRRLADKKVSSCGMVISSFLSRSMAIVALVTNCASVRSLRVSVDERDLLSSRICLDWPSLRDRILVSGAGMSLLAASAYDLGPLDLLSCVSICVCCLSALSAFITALSIPVVESERLPRISLIALSRAALCDSVISDRFSTLSSSVEMGPAIRPSILSMSVVVFIACSTSWRRMAKALRMSVCKAPRLADMLNSKIAREISLIVEPAAGMVRPWVVRIFLAVVMLVVSVRIPVPAI